VNQNYSDIVRFGLCEENFVFVSNIDIGQCVVGVTVTGQLEDFSTKFGRDS
jgi:hypothetical protein